MQLIIILERTSADPLIVNYVLRATVPLARQPYFADATKESAYKDCTPADLAALRAGEILERTQTANLSGLSVAGIKARLQADQVAFQAEVNADGVQNPFKYYGSSWDGTTWTMTGVN